MWPSYSKGTKDTYIIKPVSSIGGPDFGVNVVLEGYPKMSR